MKFEDQLYEDFCYVFPNTTVRSFSSLLGKSEGYWSSINSQKLQASQSALVSLYEAISARKILLEQSSAVYGKLCLIQRMIEDELVQRFFLKTGFESPSKAKQDVDDFYGVMPFMCSVY